jgi:hypothetical protein
VAAARASGHRVELLSKPTPLQEVFAEADGTFTAQLHAAASFGGDYPPPGAGWAKVFSGKPDQAYWNGGPDGPVAKVGQCYNDGTCDAIGIARTYVQFDIRALHGATILNIPAQTSGAEFNAHETYAPSCNGGGRDIAVDLEHVAPFGSGLTWRNQQTSFPGPIGGPRAEMHGYSSSCGPAWIGWGVGTRFGTPTTSPAPTLWPSCCTPTTRTSSGRGRSSTTSRCWCTTTGRPTRRRTRPRRPAPRRWAAARIRRSRATSTTRRVR